MAHDRVKCPNCGALNLAEADWCTLCYSSLKPPDEPHQVVLPEPRTASEGTPASGMAEGEGDTRSGEGDGAGDSRTRPAWACPSCDHLNDLDLRACEICGTPFGRLFDEPRSAPRVDPRTAAFSGVVPGLGQMRAGRVMDGVARLVLVLWLLVGGWLLLRSGLGLLIAVGSLYTVGALGIWAVSAADAARYASGEQVLLGTRPMLWGFAGTIGLFMVAVLIAFLMHVPRTP